MAKPSLMVTPSEIKFPCVRVEQPIGSFFIGTIPGDILCEITWVDVRRIVGERGFETYLGIQRPLSDDRVVELTEYVASPDACFPTAVIIAVPSSCTTYDEERREMTLSEYLEPGEGEERIEFREIAKVIDGQHRIEGLRGNRENKKIKFQVNVSIFVDMDIADQAYVFSTVNLAQTKVSKSLVYDLFDLAKTRSPQKTCHNIAVALDRDEKSPFYQRIKRLGVATKNRFNETITQATFVEALLRYISENPNKDRNLLLTKKTPDLATADELRKLLFRNMFIQGKDLEIIDVIWNYFDAVKERWPKAWNYMGTGLMLNKTNGFRALMRFLRLAYLFVGNPGSVPKKEQFVKVFDRVDFSDDRFTTDLYVPGSSGESQLFRDLITASKLPK